ncbi:transglutaminase domain-containing protein [Grimontia kaedaensis]|uniref:Transglutaminase domain-containing protein n=1 Tax=Grimontia kaedaensis TaxID=2872157 RepID=A0ABY4X158_9GAMM|nr:transglutaminase domain-containing protein [Grimontia kaedaensis]USH04946.1 transglutaminase domain-containing protein [Grimontia kaedaensis]
MNLKFYLPLMLVLAVVASLLEEKKATLPDVPSITEKQITASTSALTPAEIDFDGSNGVITLLDTKERIPHTEIARWRESLKGNNGFYTYNTNNQPFTALAPDSKGNFHLTHSYLEGYLPFKIDNPMMPMLVIARKKTYQYDHEQYGGLMEIWQSSKQSYYYPSGDCEDHAILLADWLIEAGYDARVAIGTYDGGGHAWVVLFLNGKEYVLEATQKSGFGRQYPLASTQPGYHPKMMFNRHYFWLNTGSKQTTKYASGHWKLMSRFAEQPF